MTPYQKELFEKLLKGELTPEELNSLVNWLGSDELDPETQNLLREYLQRRVDPQLLQPGLRASLDARLPEILAAAPQRSVIKMPWVRYAAAAVLVLAIGLFWIMQPKRSAPLVAVTPAVTTSHDVAAGRQGAVLTLADGRKLVLDSMHSGVVATQNGSKVLLDNGRLIYDRDKVVSEAAYNTISTPRGRQFQVLLSDGTRVWLNAASSLRYPTVFTGNERHVEIRGEAYFEVAKNAKMPFKVKVNDATEVEVLGTHFNINSYQNEASINTTLLEGSVRIHHMDRTAMLAPGQQAQIAAAQVQSQNNRSSDIKVLSSVNIEKVMAWKNGVFNFEDASLEEVMRQLERWYDVEVVYEKGVPQLSFVGKMGRDLSLANVLRGLEMSKVHWRLEGKKLIILP